MTLGEKQRSFPPLVAQLIEWAYSKGYELTFGECFRSPEQAQWDAQHSLGIANSLHTQRLAIDLNLFIDGVYQTATEAYRPMGEFWESLGGAWGGRFSRPDADHFSLEHEGVR